jgi:hypothetical protein
MTAFWDIVQRSLVEVDRRFRSVYCLHHQGDDIPEMPSSKSPPLEPKISFIRFEFFRSLIAFTCPEIFVSDLSSTLQLFTFKILFQIGAFSVKSVARDGNNLFRSFTILLKVPGVTLC